MPDIAYVGSEIKQRREKKVSALKQKIQELKDGVFAYFNQTTRDKLKDIENLVREIEADYGLELKNIAENNLALKALLQEARARLNVFNHPPQGFATFLRFVSSTTDEETGVKKQIVDVLIDFGSRSPQRVVVSPDIDAEKLVWGQRVLVSDLVVVEALDEFETIGEEAYIDVLLGTDARGKKVLVDLGHSDRKVTLYLADFVNSQDIEVGTRVLVDLHAGFVVDILPEEEESRQYFVFERPKTTFDDIGGLDDIVEKVKRSLVWPIVYAKEYEAMDLESPKGIILSGGPGVGKTMIAKATVNLLAELLSKELGDGDKAEGYFVKIGGPELQSKWVGETERQMRQLFKEARKRASPSTPVIIFFDEIDAMFPRRGSGISSDVQNTNVPQFTDLMDGLEERGDIVVIAATNRIDMIDPAVLREGRFDLKLHIPKPGPEAAKDIFTKHLGANWDQLHYKYNTDVYVSTETGEDGVERPRLDAEGTEIRHHFDKDPERVRAYLIERAVARMYDEKDPRNKFFAIRYEGDYTDTVFTYGDFASGARIAGIVRRAKFMAIQRKIAGIDEKSGVLAADLLRAIEEAYNEMASPGKIQDLIDWLSIEGKIAHKRIIDYKLFPPQNKNLIKGRKENPSDAELELEVEPEL